MDAVVWEEVEAPTSEESELSGSFVALLVLATLIAAVGIVLDSPVLIVGAMVVGPEFGPLAGLTVALVQRRWVAARRSPLALAVTFPSLLVALLAEVAGVVSLTPILAQNRLARRGPGHDTRRSDFSCAVRALVF